MQVKTRVQARQDGDKYYFTGNECCNGHVSERLVSNGNCKECGEMDKSDNIGAPRIKLFIVNHSGCSVSEVAAATGFSKDHVRLMFKALNIPRGSKPKDCVG